MSKIAIILCTFLFASATNGSLGPDVKLAREQAAKAVSEAYIISDSKNYLSKPEERVDDKTKVFAASLWKDVREFLSNDNIDQDAKDQLNNVVSEVLKYLRNNLKSTENDLKFCSGVNGGEADIIKCYKNVGNNAYEAVLKNFPKLNKEVNKLSEADCKKKCERPNSIVPTFAHKD